MRFVRALAFLLTLCVGHVDRASAAVYFVVTNATTTYTTFATCAGVCASRVIQTGTTGSPAANVTYQVVVTNAGACTAQPIGSNDGINWVSQGSAISVTAGNVTGGAAINATWQFWSATITTLTGTGATCTVTISG